MVHRIVRPGIIFLAVTLFAPASFGQFRYSMADLPEWCMETFDGNQGHPQKSRFSQMYGWHNFQHMHHYCRGLYRMRLAAENVRSTDDREFNFQRGIEEFNYILERTGADFVLKPEILLQKGTSLLALDRTLDAIDCFNEAVTLRPSYVPAYVALANYFLGAGDAVGAREVLEVGLYHAPDSEVLADMMERASR